MPRNKVDLYKQAALYTGMFPKDFTTYFRDRYLLSHVSVFTIHVSVFTITRK